MHGVGDTFRFRLSNIMTIASSIVRQETVLVITLITLITPEPPGKLWASAHRGCCGVL
jgi:hypothetical protein